MVDKRRAVIQRPEIRVELDRTMLIALRLAREGFGGGDPERILAMRADLVMSAWEYVNFQADYEETVAELNKPPTQ